MDALDNLPEIIWHYGQPFADPSMVPTYYVAKYARQHVTVVLNGDGGDELFGGYSRPVVARAAAPYKKLVPRAIRRSRGRLVFRQPKRAAAQSQLAGAGRAI